MKNLTVNLQEVSQTLTPQQIRSLSKIDLHRHLDCSMRWSTLVETAQALKIDMPATPSQFKNHFLITEPMRDLESVLKKFLIAQKVLASEEILERLAFEVCEDAFNDGVYLLELRYAPTFIADGHPSLTFEKIHQALCKGIARAEKTFSMAVGLICILQRTLDEKTLNHVTDFAIENKNTFIALDLADSEEGNEPHKFADCFTRAKKAGLHVTVHSGEAPSKLSAKRLQDTVELLHAERIGHGVQIIHHPDLIKYFIEKNITLEVCPYSNYLTQAFTTYENHPLKKLFDLGLKVTINSDDPGIFASTLTDDYFIAQNYQNFTLQNFNQCLKYAFDASFIKPEIKNKVMPHLV